MAGIAWRKLIMGSHPFIPSHAKYKRVVLTGQLSILTIVICLIFFTLDLSQGRYFALSFQACCAMAALASLLLNRQGKHLPAKILLGVAVNLTVFIFSESESIEIGLYSFFIVCSIGAIAIFGIENLPLAVFFVVLSFTLFMVSLATDLHILSKVSEGGAYTIYNIFVNFFISLVSSVVIVYFLANLNHRSETVLKENEQQISEKNQELLKLNAELDRFVYSTSHDLRSPLSSVLGLIHLAKRSTSAEEMQEYLKMMESRLANLTKFINDISDYSRNARTDVGTQPIQIKTVVHEIVENLKYYPGAEKLQVNVDLDESVSADPTRLQIILGNLISNSFKYADLSKEKPFVKVSAHQVNSEVHLAVEDNGIGIHRQFTPRIFDMFFQAHEKSEGSGLGLFIVKETVDKLHGTITVQSELGMGSKFEVNLPVQNH